LVACSRASASPPDPAGAVAPPPGQANGQGAPPAAATVPMPRRVRIEAATTTQQLLGAFSPECLSCADKFGCLDPAQKGGGVCEEVTGQARSGGQSEAAL